MLTIQVPGHGLSSKWFESVTDEDYQKITGAAGTV